MEVIELAIEFTHKPLVKGGAVLEGTQPKVGKSHRGMEDVEEVDDGDEEALMSKLVEDSVQDMEDGHAV